MSWGDAGAKPEALVVDAMLDSAKVGSSGRPTMHVSIECSDPTSTVLTAVDDGRSEARQPQLQPRAKLPALTQKSLWYRPFTLNPPFWSRTPLIDHLRLSWYCN
jgi:hypothetical protein